MPTCSMLCFRADGSGGSGGFAVTDYQYEQNSYRDNQFLKDSLECTPQQEKKVTLVADEACSGKENHCELPEKSDVQCRHDRMKNRRKP